MTTTMEQLAPKKYFPRIFNMFFDYTEEKNFPAVGWISIVTVYLVGIFIWGQLFNWFRTPLDFHDWGEINLPRYAVIQKAILSQTLPLHIDCEKCLHSITDRFFVLPDVVTTPQMLMLSVLSAEKFIFFDLIFHYTIATAGLLYLRKKFNLSLIVYFFLFTLFNFNGYIQAHYIVGHVTWTGYFLFPWFFILVFHFVEHGGSYRWVAGMAFMSLYMILAGSQHHFTWMMLFLAFLALACWRDVKWIFAAIVFSGFSSAVRLLPPLLEINTFTSSSGEFSFRSGYPSLGDFLSALIELRPVNYVLKITSEKLGYWEFDYFIGIVGASFIIFFGVYWWLRDQKDAKRFTPLLLPTALIFLLSLGELYGYTLYRFPLFASERVSARMVSLPVTLIMIMAAVYFQQFLNARKNDVVRWTAVFSFLLLFNDIFMHTELWRANEVHDLLRVEVKSTEVAIANYSDPQYIFILTVGLVLTLLTSLAVIILTLRERQIRKATV